MTKLAFKATGMGNEILRLKDDGYVSYNADASRALGGFFDAVVGVQSGEETAMNYKGKWFNLDGDHRKRILTAMNRSGVPGVLRYFSKNLGSNKWSTGKKKDLKDFLALAA